MAASIAFNCLPTPPPRFAPTCKATPLEPVFVATDTPKVRLADIRNVRYHHGKAHPIYGTVVDWFVMTHAGRLSNILPPILVYPCAAASDAWLHDVGGCQ